MKYPQKQFEKLVLMLSKFKVLGIDLSINPNALHYIVYQNLSINLVHTSFVLVENKIMLQYEANNKGLNYSKLFEIDNDFELYPTGCNDSHIETAVKRALKLI